MFVAFKCSTISNVIISFPETCFTFKVSAIRRVDRTDGPIPIRDLELSVEDGSIVPVALWREAALQDVTANTFVSISHCRMTKHASFGSKASSTNYTEIQVGGHTPYILTCVDVTQWTELTL